MGVAITGQPGPAAVLGYLGRVYPPLEAPVQVVGGGALGIVRANAGTSGCDTESAGDQGRDANSELRCLKRFGPKP